MGKVKDFFKALGAVTAISLFLALCVVCIIGELFPALLPDWVFTLLGILALPFWILFFVTIFKEWHAQRKERKKAGVQPSREKTDNRKNTFWKKLGALALEILGELVAAVMMFGIGVGIMALLGNADVAETMDSELLILLGALVVLAGFGILFAVIAIVRKIKRR